jgi:hypothetical protein
MRKVRLTILAAVISTAATCTVTPNPSTGTLAACGDEHGVTFNGAKPSACRDTGISNAYCPYFCR